MKNTVKNPNQNSKLSTFITNVLWDEYFPNTQTLFLPEGLFDHSPILIQFFKTPIGRRPFRFCKFWANQPMFFEIVGKRWNNKVKVQRLEAAFLDAQQSVHDDPHNPRAKVFWLRHGDDNTSLFHRSINQRRIQNRVNFLCVNNAFITDPAIIYRIFHDFYSALLCFKMENRRKEIKDALWSIPDDKAPVLYGLNSKFYKAAFFVVSNDVVRAFQDFFINGKLLTAWNVSAVSLIPKVARPSHPGDFHPISCCHIDLRKAYDTMEWQFIKDMLVALRFPIHFIKIVMACISSTSYSLLINGCPMDALNAQKGLR
ncbi:uncharacterized protein LOC130809239 [Amaranthus tricolor]|uniref:uncharacterized protein LOC130809239 n=1 Tax=Amaranthus tricolor TaxID=29722 RepID=UPI0025875A70|nr:uncharacterized protein LOC130809239 [Amaranthus tricolor]